MKSQVVFACNVGGLLTKCREWYYSDSEYVLLREVERSIIQKAFGWVCVCVKTLIYVGVAV